MITKQVPLEELKNMYLDIFLANTSKVTKVSPQSINNANAYGNAKLASKILKDVAVQETYLFPDAAYGSYLDGIADREGKPVRYGAAGSSTYIRVVGDPGTFYQQAVHFFTGKHGIVFNLTQDATIGDNGFAYLLVQSSIGGKFSNVDPLTINKITPSAPVGHKFVTNEVRASGGRDAEDDDTFRRRLKEGANILARGTLAYYEQLFMKINSRVLKVYRSGFSNGSYSLIVVSVNGSNFTSDEFAAMLAPASDYLTLTEFESGLTLVNPTYYNIDISARVDLDSSADPDEVRILMQIGINKILDPRFWVDGDTLYFSDLLVACKNVPKINRLLDKYFSQLVDIIIPVGQLPRLRGFVLYDGDGNLISDNNSVLSPVYYPSNPDLLFQDTVIH